MSKYLPLIIYPLLVVAPVFAAEGYPNPIGVRSIAGLVDNIAKGLLVVTLPLAAIAIIITGLKFINASVSGDSKRLEEQKKTLGWILVGSAVAIGALTLARVLVELIKKPF